MKNTILIILSFTGNLLFSQVTIEKTAPSAMPANNYVSVEFGNATGGAKGVILPWVTDAENNIETKNSVVGTLVFDAKTQKVKMATSSTPSTASTVTSVQTQWLDLSNGAATPATPFQNPAASAAESSDAKVIIGDNSSPVEGILILETPAPDTNPLAMVLPRVEKYTDIVNPSAGMMVYITSNNLFAVFNGLEWSFWKATQ